ncbi:hypothetical protein ACGFMM_04920 [Streptomyces sp. NPDC048604]|uniref:hypothetical protein n=1 Tax=Streptomyces sp. NPDC048604 TaxID=3365578 RepID=UPI003721B10F
MASEGRRTLPGAESDTVCPSCGRPVGTAVERHKIMGAWVPVWVAQPCRNPECELFERRTEGHLGEAHEAPAPQADEAPAPQPSPGTTDETGRSPAGG